MTQTQPIIDVARLVEELRERVAERRREGDYDEDLANVALPGLAPAAVSIHPGVGVASSRPLVGRIKWILLRLLWRQFDDLARQTNRAVRSARAEAAEEVARLRTELMVENTRLSDRATAADERLAKLELRLAKLDGESND
jgi:hypothetical protein